MPYTLFDHKNPTTYPPVDTHVLIYYFTIDYYTKGNPLISQRTIAEFNEGPGRKPDFMTVGAEGFDWENSFSIYDILAWELLPAVPAEIETLFKERIKEKT